MPADVVPAAPLHGPGGEGKYRRGALLILSAAAIVTWFLNWPGHYSVDSIIQMTEGVTGYFFSIHPPLMSVILGLLTRVFGHGAFMVLSSGLFFISWALFLTEKGQTPGLLLFVCLPCLVLNPLVLVYNGVVWKDVFYAHFMLVSFAFASRTHSLRDGAFYGAVTAAVLAAMVRQQGPIGLLCVCVFLGWRVFMTGSKRSRLLALLPLMISVALIAVLTWIVGLAQREKPADPTAVGFTIMARYDIAGMLINDPGRMIPVLDAHGLNGALVLKEARVGYSSLRWETLTAQYMNLVNKLGPSGISSLWRDMATTAPMALLAHKWGTWAELEGRHSNIECLPAFVGVSDETLNLMASSGVPYTFPHGYLPVPSVYSSRLYSYTQVFPLMFTGGLWLSLNAVLLALGARSGNGLIVTMCSAGILHSLSFLAIAHSCDFRYQYFTVATGLTGFMLLLCRSSEPAKVSAH